MASLKEIRKRLDSVRETKKITTAMKLVASAKFRRAQQNFLNSEVYADNMQSMLAAVIKFAKTEGLNLPLEGTSPTPAKVYIVVGSNRGLCGNFNGQLLRTASKNFEKSIKDGYNTRIIALGSKVALYFKNFAPDSLLLTLDELSLDSTTIRKALYAHISIFWDELKKTGLNNIFLVYNRFQSPIKQAPVVENILSPRHNHAMADQPRLYGLEPMNTENLLHFLEDAIISRICYSVLESQAGEQGARMFAMDNATRNADEMISDFTVSYNRLRQATITTELTEIISGAEALS